MHHTGIVVQDLPGMIAFYRDTLGLTLLWERAGVPGFSAHMFKIEGARTRAAMLETPAGNQRLELLRFEAPERPDQHSAEIGHGTAHVSFLIEDIDALYKRLTEAGVRFVNTPATLDNELGHIRAAYANDPEGNWLEFLEWGPGDAT